jgi:hypothetical protein
MNCGIKACIVSICEANSKGYVGVQPNTVTDWLAAGRQALAVKEFLRGRRGLKIILGEAWHHSPDLQDQMPPNRPHGK